jgi:Phage integrase, N-terminal SAM-like domain
MVGLRFCQTKLRQADVVSTLPQPVSAKEHGMRSSVIRQQVITDMKMAGLAARTQEDYLAIIDRFFGKVWVAPEQVTEKMVMDYLTAKIRLGVTPGTLRPMRHALQFFFQNTLRRDWDLFKKGSPPPNSNACLEPSAMRSAVSCWPTSANPSIAPACA